MQLGTFSTANGVPPTSGVNIVYNDAANASSGVVGKRDTLAASPSTGRTDYALDGAICNRNLVEGENIVSGAPPITLANVPPINGNPAPSDSILFRKNTLYIPD